MSTSDYIDALLEQYLHLLDQYTHLRNELNTLQSSVYQHISRANFSAERGIRYGQDFYDERMQASALLDITTSSSDELYSFSVINGQTAHSESRGQIPSTDTGANERLQEGIKDLNIAKPEHEKTLPAGEEAKVGLQEGIEDLNLEEAGDEKTLPAEEKAKENKAKPLKTTPLSWFGILTPGAQSLRSAQTASTTMISTIIPQIVSLDCEMKELEIRIRRARKFRAKAEAEILKHERNYANDASTKQAYEIRATNAKTNGLRL